MKTPLRHAEDGFSLVEALCAIAILAIGIMSLYTMQIGAIHANATANIVSLGTSRATDQIEKLINLNFDELIDVNGDGTGRDANMDGVDDSGAANAFGLNNTQQPLPANGWPSCDNSVADRCDDSHAPYVIFYNIANNIPVPGTKTVRVLVVSQDRGQRVVLPLTYFRTRE